VARRSRRGGGFSTLSRVERVTKLIRDEYGLWVPIVEAVYWLGRRVKRRPRPEPAFIEIVDA
jgi:hypothetical protein